MTFHGGLAGGRGEGGNPISSEVERNVVVVNGIHSINSRTIEPNWSFVTVLLRLLREEVFCPC